MPVEIPDFVPQAPAAPAAKKPPAIVIPDFQPTADAAAIPDYSAQGDKNGIEGFFDALNLFGTSAKTSLMEQFSALGEQQVSRVQRVLGEDTRPWWEKGAEYIPSPLLTLKGIRYVAGKVAGEENLAEAKASLHEYRKAQEEESKQALGVNPSLGREFVSTLGSGAGAFAAPLIAGAVAGTPGMVSTLGILTTADSEMRALDAGLPQQKAEAYGAASGLITAATSYLPVKDLFTKDPVFVHKLANFLIKQVPAAEIATVLQKFTDWYAINPEMTGKDFQSALVHDMVVTGLTAPVLGAVGVGAVHGLHETQAKIEAFQKYKKMRGMTERDAVEPLDMAAFDAEFERQLQMQQPGYELTTAVKTPSDYLASLSPDDYSFIDPSMVSKVVAGMDLKSAREYLNGFKTSALATPEYIAEVNQLIGGMEAAAQQQTIVPSTPKPLYHGTVKVFQDFEHKHPSDMLFHFSNEPSTAEYRALQKASAKGVNPKAVRIIQAYPLFKNAMEVPDAGSSPMDLAQWIEARYGKGDSATARFATIVQEAGQAAAAKAKTGKDWAKFNAQKQLVVGWMESHGFDAVKYINRVEHPTGSYDPVNTPPEGLWSYGVLHPWQILQIGDLEHHDTLTADYTTALYEQKKKLEAGIKAIVAEQAQGDPTIAANDLVAKVIKGIDSGEVQPGPIPYNVLGGIQALSAKEIEMLAGKTPKQIDDFLAGKEPTEAEMTAKSIVHDVLHELDQPVSDDELDMSHPMQPSEPVQPLYKGPALEPARPPLAAAENKPSPEENKYKIEGETDLEYRQRMTQLDTFNKFIKLSAGLEHIAKMNPHIGGLARTYLTASRAWWRTKSVWTTRANEFIKRDWRQSVTRKETTDFDTYMIEADKRSSELGRTLTPAELSQIITDKKLTLSPKAQEFAGRVWGEYRAVLDEVETQVVKDVYRTIDDPVLQQKKIAEYRNQFADMRNRNYVPHSRFGKYAVLVKATANGVQFDGQTFNAGETVFFKTFESKRLRNKELEKVKAMFPTSRTTIRGDYMIDDTVQMFQGLPEPVARMIASRMNLTKDQLEQLGELQHELSPGSRFARHFQERENVPGYSTDTKRAFADYFLRFSNHIARITHNHELQQGINEVAQSIKTDFVAGEDATKRRQIQEWMQNHYDYLNNPGNELANLRSLGFLYYLGFNPKSALVNLTQVPLIAYPHLAAKYGDVSAIASLSKAMTKVGAVYKGKARYSAEEQVMLDELTRRQILDQSSATELGAVSEGSNLQRLTAGRFIGNEKAAASIRQFAEWGSLMFQAAEKLNRRVVAVSAYDLARKNGASQSEAINAAHQAVIDTQYEYARYNRPEMMRGKKSALFLFWQYMTNTMYFIGNDPGRWRYLAMMLAAAGMQGLPGAENAMDIYDFFATKIKERTGWKDPKTSARLELRELIRNLNEMPYVDMFIPNDPNIAMHGLSSNLGGFDISGSLSMGQMIPGTEVLSTEQDADKAVSQSLQNVSGALGNVAFNIYHALGSNEPNTWRTYERLMPSIIKDASRAYRYATTGKETDTSGATIAEFDPTNWNDRILIAGQAAGFPLTKVNTEREKQFLSRDVVNYYAARRTTLFAEYQWALNEGDGEAISAVRDSIQKYNDSVPHPALRITGTDLQRAIQQRQRTKRRKEVGIPVENRQLPLYRGMEERFEPAPEKEGNGGYAP